MSGVMSIVRVLAALAVLTSSAAEAAANVRGAKPATAAKTSTTGGPPGEAFYKPPSPLPAAVHGDVIWARPLTGGGALPSAAENTLVLYHTVTLLTADVAVSGTIAIPKGTPPADGWPVISWAHGTTGNGPQCAPSRGDQANIEQRYLDPWVARGYAVVQTDYEGQGVPGIHPYFVGTAAGRDVTDMVRAARQLYPQLGTKWFVFGHSEGGSATIFSAAVGPDWAPELHLLGAVSFAPASHIAAILYGATKDSEPTEMLPYTLEMIQGISTADPAVDLNALLSPEALKRLPDLATSCIDDLQNDKKFTSLPPDKLFAPKADTSRLLHDFLINQDDNVALDVPLLIMQGSADEVVDQRASDLLTKELCRNGTRVTYDVLAGKDHGTIMNDSLAQTEAWVDAVAKGTPPKPTCNG